MLVLFFLLRFYRFRGPKHRKGYFYLSVQSAAMLVLSGPTVFIRLGAPDAYYTFRPCEWALIRGGRFFEAGRQERIKVSSKLIRKLILIVH